MATVSLSLVLLLVLIGCAVAAVIWLTRRGSVGGGQERVRSEAARTTGFARLEAEFRRLKAQFERGALTEAEFKAQLEELMIEDEGGRWWMIGYETGRWYVHDGDRWVPQEPPKAAPSAPQAHPRHPGPSRPKVGLKLGRDGLSVLVITAGWLVCWGVAGLGDYLGILRDVGLPFAIAGAIGGLITGLVLRRTVHSSPWTQVLVVTIGWLLGWLLGGPIGPSWMLEGAIAGLVGGLITALALKWTQPSIQWKHVALVTLGWVLGWAVGGAVGESPFIVAILRGALWGGIGGAVGSWVTFWQLREAAQSAA